MTNQEKIQTLIEREYTFYSEELKPYIDAVEVYFGAVPDGLLNEIRKFVGHISSATIKDAKKADSTGNNDKHGRKYFH